MSSMASQITSLTNVYATVYSGADKKKHQSSASLAFARGIHRSPVNSPHKWPVTRKMFPFDDVIMLALEKPVHIRVQLCILMRLYQRVTQLHRKSYSPGLLLCHSCNHMFSLCQIRQSVGHRIQKLSGCIMHGLAVGSQYHSCWRPDDTRSQCISMQHTDPFCTGYTTHERRGLISWHCICQDIVYHAIKHHGHTYLD